MPPTNAREMSSAGMLPTNSSFATVRVSDKPEEAPAKQSKIVTHAMTRDKVMTQFSKSCDGELSRNRKTQVKDLSKPHPVTSECHCGIIQEADSDLNVRIRWPEVLGNDQ